MNVLIQFANMWALMRKSLKWCCNLLSLTLTMMNAPCRPTWDEYAMQLAQVAAKRSEDPYQQVGACAIDSNHRVIGVAYNGLASGKTAPIDFWSDRDARRPFVIHAESNLLALIKRGECDTIACTLMPCAACATSIAAHGVNRVVYGDVYQRDTRALEIFKFYDISCVQLTSEKANISDDSLHLK